MWQEYFFVGWNNTSAILATFFGGAAAVFLALALLALSLLILVAVLAALFDRITGAMAKHWEKTGKRPAYRWAEIIAGGLHREE